MRERKRRRYPILTSNPARCSVVPCFNLRSDPGERTRHAAGHMVSVAGSPAGRIARAVVTPAHHRRPRHARARVPEERLCRPQALARERAVHLHPGGCAAVPRGGDGRRRDRRACGGGAAPALAPAARGARAGGYARRGCVLSATRGLAQQDGRVPATVGIASFFLLSYSTAARRVILSERAERARREGSAGAYEKRILRACGAQDDRPLASRKRRRRGEDALPCVPDRPEELPIPRGGNSFAR